MNIIGMNIDWLMEFGNRPHLQVLLDEFPTEGLWEKKDGVYRCINGAMIQFLCYEQPGGGFGGRTFTLPMIDGSTEELIGPWSGSSSNVNAAFKDDIVTDCSFIVPNIRQSFSGAISLKVLTEYINNNPELLFRYAKIIDGWSEEHCYEPVHADTLLPKLDSEYPNMKVELL